MQLGKLIGRLKESPQSNPVQISILRIDGKYVTPQSVDSYRGYYKDLSITFRPYEDFKGSDAMKVEEFRQMLESAIGKSFTGYKGGEFVMGTKTEVWVSQYGIASGWRVYAVEDVDNLIDKFTALILFEDHYS